MSQFDEDQRIVIQALAAQEAARVIKESDAVRAQLGQALDARIPRLMKVEKLISTWWGLLAVIISVPLAAAGFLTLASSKLDATLASHLSKELAKESSPVLSTKKELRAYSGRLSEQFAANVDSATSKLLRFGCNPAGSPVLSEFPDCVSGGQDAAYSQARDVLEWHDQTLIFKASRSSQRVLLRLRLSPVDSVEELSCVGLRLESPPLMSTARGGKTHTLKLEKRHLPDTHDFLDDSGLLRLYGSISDEDDQQAIRLDIEISDLLRKDADLHALRFRAEPLPCAAPSRFPGAERFYVHAVVVVTHSLPVPRE